MKGGLTVSELSFHSLAEDRVKFGLMAVLAFMPGKFRHVQWLRRRHVAAIIEGKGN